MKKIAVFFLIAGFFNLNKANAQMRYGSRPNPYRTHSHTGYDYSSFKPSLIFSVGYGFPNLDKNELLLFNNYYSGSVKQTGPV
ncbi:MAG TPA: hypothetical protein VGO09_05205, partial [Flavisolibacter sp.]|nr:hypothetical protein [Flavisolibacter sp.]